MIPPVLHPNHVKVHVSGPRAGLALLGFWLVWGTVVLGTLG
jgi:hypothetical protein